MIMICSSENVSIEIDTEEADANIAGLLMTCEMKVSHFNNYCIQK